VTFVNSEIAGGASWYGRILIDASNVNFHNCTFNQLGDDNYPVTIQNGSIVNITSPLYKVGKTYISGNSTVNLSCDVWEFDADHEGYIMNGYNGVNPYYADVRGTALTWKDNTCANFAEYVAADMADQSVLNLSIGVTVNPVSATGKIRACKATTINLSDSDLSTIYGETFGIYDVGSYGHGKIYIRNSNIIRFEANDASLMDVADSESVFDLLIPVYDGVADIYENIPFGHAGGHVVEAASTYNKDLIATLKVVNTPITWMGDDVLNSLTPELALKNLTVNSSFISETTADPNTPTIAEAWTLGHEYTAGQIVSNSSPIGYYLGESLAYYIVKNHTAADMQTDSVAGNIRTLFGAKLQDNGYYMSMYYSVTYSTWKPAHRLGEYHGGKYRNCDNAFFNENGGVFACNMILINVTITDHANVKMINNYSLPALVTSWYNDGHSAYTGGVESGLEYTYFENVTYNVVGYWGDGSGHGGIAIRQNANLRSDIHYYKNCSVNGKTDSALRIAAAQPPSALNKCTVDNIQWSEESEVASSVLQLIDKSNRIVMYNYIPPWNISEYIGGYNKFIKDYVVLT
jgi:hypothetical protein